MFFLCKPFTSFHPRFWLKLPSTVVRIQGLILAYCLTLSSHVQASTVSDVPVKCKSMEILSKYQHCELRQDGVHDLDCFGKYNSNGKKTCVWKTGNHTSGKTYTVILHQFMSAHRRHCELYNNINIMSKEIRLYEKYNMTVEVIENSQSRNCTKAVFRASPKSLLRCDPPYNVYFRRQSGKLDVNVKWQLEDIRAIKYYSVRYKALGSLLWNKPLVQSQNGERCTVENLNSSMIYTVQIQCVTNDKCSQCPWSKTYTVPSELKTQPVIVNLEVTEIAEKQGRRLLSLNWKFSAKELYEGYYVTIGKASGEAPCEPINTSQPEIRLILSYSAYHVSISAANNASTSPALRQTIPEPEDISSVVDGKLNITVHSSTSFTVYWKDDLIKTHVCYSVEWHKKGHKTIYMSFYQNANNHRTLSPLPEPLEPYKRYSIILHTRPNKDTCNMKYINNSESTYGTTQFYLTEGSPVSAPNISSYNVTLNSVVLQWSSIPEEHIRGFLLGYIIHYSEYHHKGTSTETNITVDPEFDTYELGNLKRGTPYQVQVSGFTQAGAGVRSTACIFKTYPQGYFDVIKSVAIFLFSFVAAVLIFGTFIIKRAKIILWPSIPNPGNSNAMQKIEGPREMELLESINTLKVEEWDTHSLQIVEKEAVVLPITLPSELPLLHNSEDEGDSTEMTCDWTQRETEDATRDILPDTFSNTKQTNFQNYPFAFSSEYTTMEMFQQVTPEGFPANTAIAQAMESDP
ncbi:interleukin-31 receptor subunit alpha isoform X1 [Xiphias gladius]|uniref:interleukin-31 receptor subunit alpha isoform X1 n=1 Tax=Xiphias gladius TaxID=8245 RepID=UPI001A9803C9|nr:interleukin-31 receptor subunit alpha isoform X1 [Xiphias gladius]